MKKLILTISFLLITGTVFAASNSTTIRDKTTSGYKAGVLSGGQIKTQIFGDDVTSAINTDSSGDLQVDVVSGTITTITNTVNVDVLTLPNLGTAAPTLYNVTMTTADTEYSQAFTNAKSVMFQCRGNYDVRYAFVTDKVATPAAPYMTLKAGRVYSEEFLDGAVDFTLYIATDTAGQIVEIEVK